VTFALLHLSNTCVFDKYAALLYCAFGASQSLLHWKSGLAIHGEAFAAPIPPLTLLRRKTQGMPPSLRVPAALEGPGLTLPGEPVRGFAAHPCLPVRRFASHPCAAQAPLFLEAPLMRYLE
jgi:hypothetical protein